MQRLNFRPDRFLRLLPTDDAFYIIQTVERDPQHPLSEDALQGQIEKAVRDWVTGKRSTGTIQIVLP